MHAYANVLASVNVFVHVHVQLSVCMCARVYVHVHAYVYEYRYITVRVHVYLNMFMYMTGYMTCIFICRSLCICIYGSMCALACFAAYLYTKLNT